MQTRFSIIPYENSSAKIQVQNLEIVCSSAAYGDSTVEIELTTTDYEKITFRVGTTELTGLLEILKSMHKH